MSLPTFPDKGSIPNRDEAVNQILSSIAMEELGLSHIINAEGEKIQYVLGTISGVSGPEEPVTIDKLLALNKSVQKTLDSTMMNQFYLKEKMNNALSSSVLTGPTGPTGQTGPTGPARINVIEEVEKLNPDEEPFVINEGDDVEAELRFGIPRGYTGATGPQGTGTAIKGTRTSKAQLDDEFPDGPPTDAYLVNGEIYIWSETEKWHSAGSLRGPTGEKGETGAPGPEASSFTIIPFASQMAPKTYANNGLATRVTLLGFTYFYTGTLATFDPDKAITLDSDGSFNLNVSSNWNHQLVFSLPFEMKITSVYATVGNYDAFLLIPGFQGMLYPYVQVYSAEPNSNIFRPIPKAKAKPSTGLILTSPANTMLTASATDINATFPAGTRIAIGGLMEFERELGARDYYLYFTGGIGLTR